MRGSYLCYNWQLSTVHHLQLLFADNYWIKISFFLGKGDSQLFTFICIKVDSVIIQPLDDLVSYTLGITGTTLRNGL